MAVSSLLYGSGSWTLNNKQRKGIEVTEIKFLRSIAGHRRSIREKIINYQRNWRDHVERMEKHGFQKLFCIYSPMRRRDRENLMKRLKDQFQDTPFGVGTA